MLPKPSVGFYADCSVRRFIWLMYRCGGLRLMPTHANVSGYNKLMTKNKIAPPEWLLCFCHGERSGVKSVEAHNSITYIASPHIGLLLRVFYVKKVNSILVNFSFLKGIVNIFLCVFIFPFTCHITLKVR